MIYVVCRVGERPGHRTSGQTLGDLPRGRTRTPYSGATLGDPPRQPASVTRHVPPPVTQPGVRPSASGGSMGGRAPQYVIPRTPYITIYGARGGAAFDKFGKSQGIT